MLNDGSGFKKVYLSIVISPNIPVPSQCDVVEPRVADLFHLVSLEETFNRQLHWLCHGKVISADAGILYNCCS